MRQTRGALQGCIYAGLIYAAVETLPVAILGSELSCGSCGTEEWYPSPPGYLLSFCLKSLLVFATDLPFISFPKRRLINCALSLCVCLLVATLLL